MRRGRGPRDPLHPGEASRRGRSAVRRPLLSEELEDGGSVLAAQAPGRSGNKGLKAGGPKRSRCPHARRHIHRQPQIDLVVGPAGVASRGLDLLDGATSYHLSGGLRLHPLAAENLHVDVEEAQAARLARNVPGAPEITGTLSAHVTLSGPLAGPVGAGVVTLRQGSIAGAPLDRAEVRFAAGGGREVQILGADAERNGSRVHAEGTVGLRGPLDLRLSATGIDPGPRAWSG